jgi:hypothetical protein
MPYIPTGWFWLADDGRIFGSYNQSQTTSDDPDYVAFLTVEQPTPWPRDKNGQQTDAALQAVLDPHNVFVNPTYYAANQRWLTENGGITVSGLSSAPNGMPLLTDDRSKNLVGLAHSMSLADKSFNTTWVAPDGNNYDLTNADIQDMATQLYTHIHDCFITYVNAIGGLQSGKIKTRAQIDEMFGKVRERAASEKSPSPKAKK